MSGPVAGTTSSSGPDSVVDAADPRVADGPGVWGTALVTIVGAAAVTALAVPVPAASGARRALAPSTLLAVLDVVWMLVLLWPRSGSARARATSALLAAAIGAPFHAAIAAGGGAALGHTAACFAVAGCAAVVGALAGPRRLYVPLASIALLALPLIGYAITDFTGVDALWMVGASPLTALVGMARLPADVVAADALAPCVTLLLVALAAMVPLFRSRATASGMLVTLALGTLAGPASAADDVEALFGGVVRAGRPVTVRAPGARRVRAEGGPWALPVGARGDEFVLHGVTVAGETVRVEADVRGSLETHDVPVRPVDAAGTLVARLGGAPAGPGEVAVPVADLPTVREAWLVFDAVDGVPPAIPAEQRAALEAFADRGPRAFPFEPALLAAGPHAFRATAAAAERAARLPPATARVLVVLAVLELFLLALVRHRIGQRGARNELAAAIAMPLVALAWLHAGHALPGPVRATALLLEGESDTLVLVRLTRSAPAAVTVDLPASAGAVVPLRWDASGSAPAVAGAGTRADVDLTESRIALLAYRVPATGHEGPTAAGSEAAWVEAARAWVQRHGLDVQQREGGAGDVLPRIDGVPVFLAGRAAIRPR